MKVLIITQIAVFHFKISIKLIGAINLQKLIVKVGCV